MRTKIAEYQNGNVNVIRFDDGTVIRYSEDDEFRFDFPENLDVKISDRCDVGCLVCHEGSTKDGKIAENLLNQPWIDTLKPYTEIALGGGNVFEHPDFFSLLEKLRTQKVFANITVNQLHFMENLNLIRWLVKKKLIWGIGVSLAYYDEKLFEVMKEFPNAVLHVIAGILTQEDLCRLMTHHDLKILFLGYKRLRRGQEYYDRYNKSVDKYLKMTEDMLPLILEAFKVVSFDCLAIEQLHIKDHLPSSVWEHFFQGDDGTMTFYIDAVNEQFATSSTTPIERRWDFTDCPNVITEMFNVIKYVGDKSPDLEV